MRPKRSPMVSANAGTKGSRSPRGSPRTPIGLGLAPGPISRRPWRAAKNARSPRPSPSAPAQPTTPSRRLGFFRLATVDDPLERPRTAHLDAIKESQRASSLIDVRPRQLISDQMQLVSADILNAESIRRRPAMSAKLSDRVDVRLLRRGREVADRHVFDHALAKRAHRSHRW